MFFPITGFPINMSSFEAPIATWNANKTNPMAGVSHENRIDWVRNEQNISLYSIKRAGGFQAKGSNGVRLLGSGNPRKSRPKRQGTAALHDAGALSRPP